MFNFKTKSLFGQTKQHERQIDQFVDILSEVGLVFKSIVPLYLNNGITDKFDEKVKLVSEMESKADKITKDVERALYEESLILFCISLIVSTSLIAILIRPKIIFDCLNFSSSDRSL